MITAKLLRAVGANPRMLRSMLRFWKRRVLCLAMTLPPSAPVVVWPCWSQLSHESGHYSTLSENLNYSVAALSTGELQPILHGRAGPEARLPPLSWWSGLRG